ncbi:hypothetical protein [Caulobacter vibrioides]|uniref:hypothetical protein n=1 Tax=Caulobacter vibrioides TaxID=155892 RepID=UPI0006C86AF4|nr:hypothetical protein [Caulobacter vibrioides]
MALKSAIIWLASVGAGDFARGLGQRLQRLDHASGDARGDHARGYAAQHDANRVDAPLDRPREDRVLGRQQLGRELE